MENKYSRIVKTAIRNAEANVSKITDSIVSIEGMSGVKTRHFYNNLLSHDDARYLEIGTWKGSSVCSAMCGNSASVVCIDNWSEFNGPKNDFLTNFEQHKGNNTASFIESDCFSVDVSLLPKFNTYLYDGNHTAESHSKALSYYYQCLDDVFIFVVDDWNEDYIRKTTFESIDLLNLDPIYESEKTTSGCTDWWNGLYVGVLRKTTVK